MDGPGPIIIRMFDFRVNYLKNYYMENNSLWWGQTPEGQSFHLFFKYVNMYSMDQQKTWYRYTGVQITVSC